MLETWVPIVPQHIWGSISGTRRRRRVPELVRRSIGSGPFQVVQWVKGDYVRLIANKHYWGGAPKIDELILRMYTNADTLAHRPRSRSCQYADWRRPQFRCLRGPPEA